MNSTELWKCHMQIAVSIIHQGRAKNSMPFLFVFCFCFVLLFFNQKWYGHN